MARQYSNMYRRTLSEPLRLLTGEEYRVRIILVLEHERFLRAPTKYAYPPHVKPGIKEEVEVEVFLGRFFIFVVVAKPPILDYVILKHFPHRTYRRLRPPGARIQPFR